MKTFLILLLSTLLAGCFGTTKPDVQIRYQTVVVAPEDDMLKDCEVTAPPSRQAYVSADWSEKERLVLDNINDREQKTVRCNIRLQNLREWKAKQVKLHTPTEPAKKD